MHDAALDHEVNYWRGGKTIPLTRGSFIAAAILSGVVEFHLERRASR
jgi:hypothetical protein